MPLYETVVIARSEITQAQADAVADAVAPQLEPSDGAAVKKREYWGLRNLAYRIKKNRKGHYILLGLDAPPAPITEMERQLQPERRRAALHDRAHRRNFRGTLGRSCRASPTTASAASAGRSRPGASRAAASAASMNARNSARATSSAPTG